MFVGYFHQFPPVGDIPLYEKGGDGNILSEYIKYVVQLVESRWHLQEEDDNDPAQKCLQFFLLIFSRVLYMKNI